MNKGQTRPPKEQTSLAHDHFVCAGLPGQSRALRYERLRCPQCGLSWGPSLLPADGAKDAIYPPLSHKHSHDLEKCLPAGSVLRSLLGAWAILRRGTSLPRWGQLSCACHAGNHVPGGLGHVRICAQTLRCTDMARQKRAWPCVWVTLAATGTPRNSSGCCLSRLSPGYEAENTYQGAG